MLKKIATVEVPMNMLLNGLEEQDRFKIGTFKSKGDLFISKMDS